MPNDPKVANLMLIDNGETAAAHQRQQLMKIIHKLPRMHFSGILDESVLLIFDHSNLSKYLGPAMVAKSERMGALGKVLIIVYITLNVVIYCTALNNTMPQDCWHGKALVLSAQSIQTSLNHMHYMKLAFTILILILPVPPGKPSIWEEQTILIKGNKCSRLVCD